MKLSRKVFVALRPLFCKFRSLRKLLYYSPLVVIPRTPQANVFFGHYNDDYVTNKINYKNKVKKYDKLLNFLREHWIICDINIE